MTTEQPTLPPRRLSLAELSHLRNRLPVRGGIISQIARQCGCSSSKVSRVFSGDLYDHKIIEVARIYAEKYEADMAKLLDGIRQTIAASFQP